MRLRGLEAETARPGPGKILPLAFLLVILTANIAALFCFDTYPFVDLPNHMAEARIYHGLSAGDPELERYYSSEISVLKPNILHILFIGSFEDAELGARLFITLYMVMMAAAAVMLTGSTGGDRWYALLSLPLLYNMNMVWGFIGFAMAVPLAVMACLTAFSLRERPSALKGAVLGALSLLIYYSSAIVFVFVVPLVLLMMLCRRWGGPRRDLAPLAFLAPSVALLVAWRLTGAEFSGQKPLHQFLAGYYGSSFPRDMAGRIPEFLWNDSRLFATGAAGRAVALLMPVSLLFPFVAGISGRAESEGRFLTRRRWLAIAAVYFAICYLALPDRLPAQHFLYRRFSVLALAALAALAGARSKGRVRTAAAAIAASCAVAYTAMTIQALAAFEKDASGIREVLEGRGRGKVLSAVIGDARFRTIPSMIHFNNYHIIWNGGAAATKTVDYRFGAIRRADGVSGLPFYMEWIREGTDIERLLSRYASVDILLVRGDRPQRVVSADPSWRFLKSSGGWSLYENRGAKR